MKIMLTVMILAVCALAQMPFDAEPELESAAAVSQPETAPQATQPSNTPAKSKPSLLALPFNTPVDWSNVSLLLSRFLVNIIFAYILISIIYAKKHRIREYSFSFFISNILIFMVTSLLASVKVKTGFAFGLFAILSILRYRTEQIQIREMTFLFASIILGVMNSLATSELSLFEVALADTLLVVSMFVCEKTFMGNVEQILLIYDNSKLLAKDKKKELFEDIKNRFGYDVVKVVITEMSYLTDSAKIKLVYRR